LKADAFNREVDDSSAVRFGNAGGTADASVEALVFLDADATHARNDIRLDETMRRALIAAAQCVAHV
jgi:hypothetical protein